MNVEKLCPGCMTEIENRGQYARCPHCGYNLANMQEAPHRLQPLTLLDKCYVIGRVIGEGGFGITYLGADTSLNRCVAIKEFYPHQFVSRNTLVSNEMNILEGENKRDIEKWRDKSIEEARTLAKFSDLPGVVKVYYTFEANNTSYMVMEYLDGLDLKQYLKQMGEKLPTETVLEMMKPVITFLDQIHSQNFIHRDISPDNIKLTKQGEIKLLDFGAAYNVTNTENKSVSVQLKQGYAPEEQYRSRGNLGAWTDVYALCATIYRCITGYTPPQSIDRCRNDTLLPPSQLGVRITPQQENAIMRGLAVYAENRIRDMKELYACLYSYGTITPPPPPPTPPKPPKPNVGLIIAAIAGGASILLILIVVVVVLVIGSGKSSKQDQTEAPPEIEETTVQEETADETNEEEAISIVETEFTNENIRLGDECIAQNDFFNGFNYYLKVTKSDPDYQVAYERIHQHLNSYVEYAKSIGEQAEEQPNYDNYVKAIEQLDEACNYLDQMIEIYPEFYEEFCEEILYLTASTELSFANYSIERAANYSNQRNYEEAENLLVSVHQYIVNRPQTEWHNQFMPGYEASYHKTFAQNANAKTSVLRQMGYGAADIASYVYGVLAETDYNCYSIELYDVYAQEAGIMYPVEKMKYSGDYIIPDSDVRELSREEISGLSRTNLRMARFEIYARHGRRFSDINSVQNYFDSKNWYIGRIDPTVFDEGTLSEVEKANVRLIAQYEIERGYIY